MLQTAAAVAVATALHAAWPALTPAVSPGLHAACAPWPTALPAHCTVFGGGGRWLGEE